MGSLTTPPCTQGVVWTIVKRVGLTKHEIYWTSGILFPPSSL
jgi:carbonic anhydrase